MCKLIKVFYFSFYSATDMARHNEIVNQFREIVPYFDRNNKMHVNLV